METTLPLAGGTDGLGGDEVSWEGAISADTWKVGPQLSLGLMSQDTHHSPGRVTMSTPGPHVSGLV